MDKIPLRIQGGRADGYRGFAFKSNYSAGKWKIEIRTSSGIEIARLYFSLNVVEINESRVMRIIQK